MILGEGKPTLTRFAWSNVTPNSARWQQAFSDDGKTGSTNWIMEFQRSS